VLAQKIAVNHEPRRGLIRLLYGPIDSFEKLFGLFLQFFNGLLFNQFILKQLVCDVQEGQNNQIKCRHNRSMTLDDVGPFFNEFRKPLNVPFIAMPFDTVFSTEQSNFDGFGRYLQVVW
jgi:hypothetical protein